MGEFKGGAIPIERHTPRMTRRGFLARVVVGSAGLGLAGRFGYQHRDEIPGIGPKIHQQDTSPLPSEPGEDPKEIEQIKMKLNEIKILDLYDEGRMKLEEQYVKDATSLKQIDMGFWALGRTKNRVALLQKRADLREKGHPNLPQLSKEQKDWAAAQKIHPEVLAICLDAYEDARDVINYLKPALREDFKNEPNLLQALPPETFMLSPGGMARLICEETGEDVNGRTVGFGFIGGGLAKDQYDGIYKDTGKRDLEIVCKHLTEDTGLAYAVDNVQGSKKPTGHESGGAIGIQMMPDTVLGIYDLLKTVPLVDGTQIKFNPFDLQLSVLGAWVKLAQQKRIQLSISKEDWRYGIYVGNDENTKYALAAWNPFPKEYNAIFDSDIHYRNNFTLKAP